MTDEKNKAKGNSERWFLAKIVFQIIVGEEEGSQFDEQYRLISAFTEGQAFEKAKKIGQHAEGTFLNTSMERVCWKFIDVSALHSMDLSAEGTEVYSETYESENPSSYIYNVHERAKAWKEPADLVQPQNLFR